jgi:glycosyltransferase involved in cell wall biosynthesis
MKAFDLYRKKSPSQTQLLIVGGGLYKTSLFHDFRNQLKNGDSIHFPGRLPDNELNKLLGAAISLVYVPYFEGFGIPLIEAMQCGVPIISSNTSSMPEVAGNAALLVDPESTEEISKAMQDIAQDKSLREKLIAEGNKRKDLFSWSNTAEALWQSIMKCL